VIRFGGAQASFTFRYAGFYLRDTGQVEVKRLLNILISGIALVIFLPFFLITAIAIKLTASGPVFFVQERIGLNKRRFRVYKFRAMVPDAEKNKLGWNL
jgi:lipopolysaccharide/colanic/teichoic acid biosynthesis glycosyltransferase